MKKIALFPAAALMLLAAACSQDNEPKIQTPTAAELQTPAFATELVTLKEGMTVDLTLKQPSYGLDIVPTYTVDVAYDEAFTEFQTLPTRYSTAEIAISAQELATAMCTLSGYEDEVSFSDAPRPVYIRVISTIPHYEEGTIVSNTLCLEKVAPYFALKMPEYPMLYVPGAGNGWNFESGWLNTSDFASYYGFVLLGNEFKVTNAPKWGDKEWGAGEEEGTLKAGGDNVKGDWDGSLYWMTINLRKLTFQTTKIEKIATIGDFEGNSWANDQTELMPTADNKLIWTATVAFTKNTEWKLRCNSSWDINLGGQLDNLTNGGGNITTPAGTYLLTLNVTTVPYTMTLQKQ